MRIDKKLVDDINNILNKKCKNCATKVSTTYKSDDNAINFSRHIRNSVAHSSCKYSTKDKTGYVEFNDTNNKNETCKFTLKTSDMWQAMLDILQLICDYLDSSKIKKQQKISNDRANKLMQIFGKDNTELV